MQQDDQPHSMLDAGVSERQKGMLSVPRSDKSTRGNASQFFVAGELCRRGYSAVVTLGNTPNTDILCSNIQGMRTCSVGLKAERNFGDNFFWVLGGIPEPKSQRTFEYYVIPAAEMAENVTRGHQQWLVGLGARGQARNDSKVRTVHLPPFKSFSGWDISGFHDRWDLIEAKLKV